jgi:hypothetical protein
MIFIGEDRINHTGNLEEIHLNMGKAFDISADSRLVSTTHPTKNTVEKEYEITIKNGSSRHINVNTLETFNGIWHILKVNHPSQKITAHQAKWVVTVPAGSESNLNYRVQEQTPDKNNERTR